MWLLSLFLKSWFVFLNDSNRMDWNVGWTSWRRTSKRRQRPWNRNERRTSLCCISSSRQTSPKDFGWVSWTFILFFLIPTRSKVLGTDQKSFIRKRQQFLKRRKKKGRSIRIWAQWFDLCGCVRIQQLVLWFFYKFIRSCRSMTWAQRKTAANTSL